MTAFIFNQSHKSGGHWHIAKNLRITRHAETREEKTREVIDFNHGVPISERDPEGWYYTPKWGGAPDTCDRCRRPESDGCHKGISLDRYSLVHPYEPPKIYPILGLNKATIITPAYMTAEADGACGQADRIKTSNLRMRDVFRILTSKKNIGKELTITHIITRLMVETEFVPEPLCGHCFKLLERDA